MMKLTNSLGWDVSSLSLHKIDRCDILILLDEDMPPFPTIGPFVKNHTPRQFDEVCELSRPLTNNWGEAHCRTFWLLSSEAGRGDRLAILYVRKKMMAEGLGALKHAMDIPQCTDPWYAIVEEEKAIPGLLYGLGRKGGNGCLVRYFSINYLDFSPRFTLSWRTPPSRPRCSAHLPYTARCIIKQYPRIQQLQVSFVLYLTNNIGPTSVGVNNSVQ